MDSHHQISQEITASSDPFPWVFTGKLTGFPRVASSDLVRTYSSITNFSSLSLFPLRRQRVIPLMALKSLLKTVFFLFLVLFFGTSAGLKEREGCYIEAIYSFGDSIADTGNLIREGVDGAFAPIAHLPYGETTFKRPTGRCSNGLLMIDYLALSLKLPFVNPYLDKDANFNHGVNFAVAGGTALDVSFFKERGIMMPYTNSSLNVQLEWFKSHLDSICSSQTDCAEKLKHALFLVGEIGGNDYNYAFFGGKSITEVMNYVPHVVTSIINAAKEVINMGAIQLVIPGNFPIGCLPSYLTALNSSDPDAYDNRLCLKGPNTFAMLHNLKLQEAIQELRESYPHVVIMYADYYNAFMTLLDNALDLGFDKNSLMKACCGGGGEHNFDATKMCGSPGASTCDNPAQHISWDGIHLTQEAYMIMARQLISGGFVYPSYGVQEKWKCWYRIGESLS
ncbi:GDSL esterase/lipase At5g03980 isoform X2 [Elaeis guineensis]|uniref:GDSL esterase/lipase At5g03980 isoform X2 n=1 Tax=Elaeis guineensis var. tenera TaxID=51953 RepID=A0A6I9R134_ELAGV|nr:GDSL esterase/lipase At5g03980 isoform X2 [Elaeis guineensis]